jgi:hypothetical protein
MERSLPVLGVCWIIYGLIRFAMALGLIAFTKEATVMFGTLLVEIRSSEAVMADFHAFYLLAIILAVLSGICGLAAGVALLVGKSLGRTLAIIAAFLSLSDLPIGITLGVYTLWLLPHSASQRSITQ